MDKYLAVISNSIKKNLAYRANSIITIVSVFFSFVVLFYFWSSIYQQGNKIGNYSLTEIISYYVFLAIFELMIVSNTAWGVTEEIKNGQITNSILKPIKYLEYKFSQSVGSFLYRLILYIIPITWVLFILSDYMIHLDNNYAWFLAALVCVESFILNFLIFFMVGLVAFWVGDAYGFLFSFFVIINFMQGALVPLDLLPGWFLVISEFLPFKYLFFVPVGLMTQRMEANWLLFIIPFIWIVVLYFLAKFIYAKGLKKYEGFGI